MHRFFLKDAFNVEASSRSNLLNIFTVFLSTLIVPATTETSSSTNMISEYIFAASAIALVSSSLCFKLDIEPETCETGCACRTRNL